MAVFWGSRVFAPFEDVSTSMEKFWCVWGGEGVGWGASSDLVPGPGMPPGLTASDGRGVNHELAEYRISTLLLIVRLYLHFVFYQI